MGRLCHLLVYDMHSFLDMLELRLNVSLPGILCMLYTGLCILH